MGSGASKNSPRAAQIAHQNDNVRIEQNAPSKKSEPLPIVQKEPRSSNPPLKPVRTSGSMEGITSLLAADIIPAKQTSSEPKTNVAKESKVYEAARLGNVEQLTNLLNSNPSLLYVTTSMDLNYHDGHKNNVKENFIQG
jgi:hypothetical protein